MYPPSTPGGYAHVDLSALSGIAGSISIACWVVVFSPQIIENFRRGSAEGLSVTFIIIWLAGDVFNILGAILQGVLPTMIILAVYYTLADIVLLGQVWYYRGFTWRDEVNVMGEGDQDNGHKTNQDEERQPLLNGSTAQQHNEPTGQADWSANNGSILNFDRARSGSQSSSGTRRRIDGVYLSPATPFIDHPPQPYDLAQRTHSRDRRISNEAHDASDGASMTTTQSKRLESASSKSSLQSIFLNIFAILLVCAAGVLGWYVSSGRDTSHERNKEDNRPKPIEFDTLGQIFGYFCALLYLGSRIPQLLLNYRRKSTEGISLLFFLFACIGNLTYVLSIFAFDSRNSCVGGRGGIGAHPSSLSLTPVNKIHHHGKHRDPCSPGEPSLLYQRYIAVNASWILGSLGTLFLDMAIFVQFFMYHGLTTSVPSTPASSD